jgi:hypothetical protein
MRISILLVVFLAAPAQADLYRWIDPETGSVKISSMPPSDPTVSAQVVPFRAPAVPKPPTVALEMKPPAAAATGDVGALQARFAEILQQLTGVKPQDYGRAGEGIRQQIAAYEAVRIELDRLDPAGAARRQSESASVFDKLKQGLAAQFSTTPPGK